MLHKKIEKKTLNIKLIKKILKLQREQRRENRDIEILFKLL